MTHKTSASKKHLQKGVKAGSKLDVQETSTNPEPELHPKGKS